MIPPFLTDAETIQAEPKEARALWIRAAFLSLFWMIVGFTAGRVF